MVDIDTTFAISVEKPTRRVVRIRRRRIAIMLSTAIAIATVATGLILGSGTPSYRATAQVVLVPSADTAAELVPSAWESLTSERATAVATAILTEPQWLGPASVAAAIPPETLTIRATAISGTTLIQLTSVAPDPRAAEVALDSVIESARMLVERLSGPVALVYSQPSTGTAVTAGIPRSTTILTGATGPALLVSVMAWTIRNRKREVNESSAIAGTKSSDQTGEAAQSSSR
ncbi:hypothetical protein [Pseudonocardia sp. D17]|uniref:hypothetical protein n=1 Tax=Pseudonocardia sp. D17 TaxID=882661 RepID=UPI002B3CA5EA|nr:hypothetical protein PSD17_05490 [Pseudonocardia sp. D17]